MARKSGRMDLRKIVAMVMRKRRCSLLPRK
jgi:hypothetical protein